MTQSPDGGAIPAPLEGLLEACLYAEDLDAAQAFYCTVLGLEVYSPADGRNVFFRCGNGMFLVFNPERTRIDDSNAPAHGCVGPGHVAFRISDETVDAWKQHLGAREVTIEREIEWPNGARSLYFRDPAGNCIELATGRLWGI